MTRSKPIREAEGECLMGATVLGERGQVVIPKDIRQRLGLRSGAKLMVLNMKNGPIVLIPMEKMQSFVAQVNERVSSFLKEHV
jgi:AbrB family looped-hinge helix DNA binding protein